MSARATDDKPWSKRAPENRVWDAVVIGSGMGGMTTAAMLAKLGKRVLVLEQHYVPGGFTHVFKRPGFEWDVGVHIVGEASTRALPGRVLHALTDGRLEWTPVGSPYDTFYFPDGFKIGFPDNLKDFAQALKDAFPDEATNIDTYLSEMRHVVKGLRGFWLEKALGKRLSDWFGGWITGTVQSALGETAETALARLFRDPRLRTVAAAQWGYHGSPPSQASWAAQCAVARHFVHGAYYPAGGAASIARELLRTVAEAGGWTRISADVQEILIEDGRAVGVKMADGEEIRAKRVVSAAGAYPTVMRLLPESQRDTTWAQAMADHPPSPAHVSLYLGFAGDIEKAGATKSCQWFYQQWHHEGATWDVSGAGKLKRPPVLFTSYPSIKDPRHEPGQNQHHTGEIVTFVPWETFKPWLGTRWHHRGAEYEDLKERMTESILEVMREERPELVKLIKHQELSTPLSTDRFARPYHGAIYGLAAEPGRFNDRWLRAKSPIPGLYLSGSDIAMCGVMGAALGGALCALAMEPVRGIRFLAKHR